MHSLRLSFSQTAVGPNQRTASGHLHEGTADTSIPAVPEATDDAVAETWGLAEEVGESVPPTPPRKTNQEGVQGGHGSQLEEPNEEATRSLNSIEVPPIPPKLRLYSLHRLPFAFHPVPLYRVRAVSN